ncbi:uncharacterized protein LOC131008222 [Salvia miltiorrhiza]|uniref:uncharacterized protein LOC131008222 n=1 Tax=Salvia miltiorrhiza TaxID=226208 RepID=UPI0025AB741E|nr:uncharacterized protein LOC131008222 [Salvia miltiorrhiza]
MSARNFSSTSNSLPATEVYRQRRLSQMKRKRSKLKQQNSCDINSSILNELKKVSDCTYCGATKFEYEPPTFCCDNGKVILPFSEIPEELYELFTSESQEAMDFRRNIRSYNSIFSFTSFEVKLDKELASSRRGIYSFRAQGMVYHDLPGLTPQDSTPCFFQLYFYETGSEVENRMNIMQNQNISETVVKKIIKILEVNPYAKVFRRLKDYP